MQTFPTAIARHFRVVAAVLAGLVAGVTLTGGPLSARAQPPEWQAALIALSDLPTGWTEEAPAAVSETTRLFCTGEVALRVTYPVAQAAFQRSDTGPFLSHQLAVLDSADATARLDQLRALPLPCEWDEPTASGEMTHWTLRRMSFPQIGDESVALRATITSSLWTIDVGYLYWRRSTVVGYLALADAGTAAITISVSDLEHLARLADERLQAVLAAQPSATNPGRPSWAPSTVEP